ncbi:MAG TPA: M56 family metallopeptidase [Terriglobales bacterium]|nr:M56 family metallopeptidase [Terriglobales bacterium]
MYAIRGLLLSASVFFLLYGLLSLGVASAWRVLARDRRQCTARQSASLLFALRMIPLLGAALVTCAFMVPSFLLLEPHSVEEPLGWPPRLLGIGCLLILGLGAFRVAGALARSTRVVARWMRGAETVLRSGPVPVFRVASAIPAFTVAGIRRPKVLLSEASAALLTDDEIETALRHEWVHARRRDNLKKLLLRFAAFPGMAALEHAWLQETEMAADDEAVSSLVEALDLASALIKLSRFSAMCQAPELTTGLVHSPAAKVDARVKRLIAWGQQPACDRRPPRWYLPAIGTLLCLAMTYTTMLSGMHEVTEWLVR